MVGLGLGVAAAMSLGTGLAACGNSDTPTTPVAGADAGPVTQTQHDGGTTVIDSGSTPTVDSGSPSTAALDGMWNITKIPASFFGNGFATGTIAAGSGTYTMTLLGGDIGQPDPDDPSCTITKDGTVVTLTITGTTGTGTVKESYQESGSSCDNTDENDYGYALTLTQTTAHTPTTTPYDGVWTVSVAEADEGDDAGSPGTPITVTITGTSWTATANTVADDEDSFFDFSASGSFANGMATGTDGTLDFAAQKQ